MYVFLKIRQKPDRYAILEGGDYAPCQGRNLMSKSNLDGIEERKALATGVTSAE